MNVIKHPWLRSVIQAQGNSFKGLLPLGIIWLISALCDRLWFALDHSIPAWDQAEYLTGTLNYWSALQHPQWFSGEWWASFWQLSSKVPPLTYIATGVVQTLFGTGPDQATLVNLFFNGILLIAVYRLGVQLFSPAVGFWAAILSQLLPSLYQVRLDFLLDYPLTAVVTLSFWCLTAWRSQSYREVPSPQLEWLWAAAFGLSLGLALMVKQTALFFLLIPLLWLGVGTLWKRAWGRLAQLFVGVLLSALVWGWWYRLNWLLVLTSGKRATIDSAIAEGDPSLNQLNAWLYYWKILPYQVSWVLLLVPIVGLLLYAGKKFFAKEKFFGGKENANSLNSLAWLGVFLVGSYLLSSLNINKDARYVLPYLPSLCLLLAYGLTLWSGSWGKRIRWGTVALAALLMLLNIFPVPGSFWRWVAQTLSPYAQHPAYVATPWPHRQAIAEIIQTDPYLRSTLGVLPSTATLNQHNVNYYGALEQFQVYGRQIGVRKKHVPQDARSLSWFLTKTGDQGSVPEAQALISQIVEQGSEFRLHKTWNLPDASLLKLYHRQIPPIQVQPLAEVGSQLQLNQVIVPEKAPPGVPVPVTYEWSGDWEQLQSGLVLLTWRSADSNLLSPARWLHDHGIAMGELHPARLTPNQPNQGFRVRENMAMLPPAEITPGLYRLEATYLNRQTGATYPIAVPPVTLQIDPAATATPAPELDLLTQLRTVAATLPQGTTALEPLFDQIGRINMYDPIQDYLIQVQQSLAFRLQQEPQNRDWAYGLALSRALKRQVQGAIAALEQVVQLDAQNPYAYAYLAFVQLYNWHPQAAQKTLKPAIALNPSLPELQALNGAAALMQGNFVQGWNTFQELKIRFIK